MNLIPNWRPITKRTLDLFGRWGDPRTQLRSMLDSTMPVVVVDRFRDDDEGSVFGMHLRGTSIAARIASVSFGSATNDWELLAVTELAFSSGFIPFNTAVHMFTPIFPYNPAEVPSPAAFASPGLINNRNFTFGTVQGLGGYASSFAAFDGPFVAAFKRGFSAQEDLLNGNALIFDVPVRMYADTTLTFQWLGSITNSINLFVSILYRERPKTSTQ